MIRGANVVAAGLVLLTTMLSGGSTAQTSKARGPSADGSRVVVVELFTSQG